MCLSGNNYIIEMKPKEIDIPYKFKDTLLYNIDLPVEDFAISDLSNNLDICYLEKEGTDDWNLCPRELMANFDKEVTHAGRVKGVDLNFPICIYKYLGQWIILDGVHRFTKAMMEGRKTIKVKKVPESTLLEILK